MGTLAGAAGAGGGTIAADRAAGRRCSPTGRCTQTAKIGYSITYRLRSLLFTHLQRLSLAFHHRSRSGELLTKVASDTNQLRDMFADWALSFAAQLLTLVTMLGVMFWLNWRLAGGGGGSPCCR